MNPTDVSIRSATVEDASDIAALHASRIAEGFLSHLGPHFLRLLYRRVIRSDGGFAQVAVTDARIVGFAAGVVEVGALYRSFLVRDGLAAGVMAAPRLLRSWRRVFETLRYPAHVEHLPGAEILAVAVHETALGRGVGRRLVDATLDEFGRRGTPAVKVVTHATNLAALALYEACGFARQQRVAVHQGTPSEVLVWPSS